MYETRQHRRAASVLVVDNSRYLHPAMRGLFMHHKQVSLSIKCVDDDAGTFTGLASVFDNLDLHGDIVRRGAFSKSLAAAQPIPLLWMHKSDDPVTGSVTSSLLSRRLKVCRSSASSTCPQSTAKRRIAT